MTTATAQRLDFDTLAPEHRDVHAKLENWGRWVKGGRRLGTACAPMFRLYRSSEARTAEPLTRNAAPDELEAWAIEQAVAKLPEPPREALRWYYVTPWVQPFRLARYLGVSMGSLPALVHDGRALLRAALANPAKPC